MCCGRLLAAWLAACAGSSGGTGSAGTGGSGGSGGTEGACTVYPRQTEGPYYLDGDLVRSDITEGKGGVALDTTGEQFLRGTQLTGNDGRVTFRTIYPGWYPGRTTHIHFTVHLSSTSEAT